MAERWRADYSSLDPGEVLGIATTDGRPILHPTDEGTLAVDRAALCLILTAPERAEDLERALAILRRLMESCDSYIDGLGFDFEEMVRARDEARRILDSIP